MFRGENDDLAHAQKLVDMLKGLDCRVNLIRFHESPEAPFKTSMPTTIKDFQDYLNRHGVICTLRASRGQDIDAACERGIVVTNVPAYSTESVAQMVFAHLLTVTNRTEHYARQNREGRWTSSPDFSYWDTRLTELAGKTFGIVGLGNIGSRVAAIANAFGMKVTAYTSKEASLLPPYIHKGTMAEVLEQSDVVSLHCPLTDNTHHLICRDTLKLMKPTAILINTGRGPLVCEEDVAEALNTGSLYAYCADVLSKEPAEASNPLLKCPAAYITPHIAWATEEARRRLVDVAVGNVCAFVGGTPQNVISA